MAMPATDLCYLGLVEVGQQIHAKKLSPVEVTRAMLDRIERLDGRLKSYAYVMADSALAEAAVAEKEIAAGKIKGPLHGVPVAIEQHRVSAAPRRAPRCSDAEAPHGRAFG